MKIFSSLMGSFGMQTFTVYAAVLLMPWMFQGIRIPCIQ